MKDQYFLTWWLPHYLLPHLFHPHLRRKVSPCGFSDRHTTDSAPSRKWEEIMLGTSKMQCVSQCGQHAPRRNKIQWGNNSYYEEDRSSQAKLLCDCFPSHSSWVYQRSNVFIWTLVHEIHKWWESLVFVPKVLSKIHSSTFCLSYLTCVYPHKLVTICESQESQNSRSPKLLLLIPYWSLKRIP